MTVVLKYPAAIACRVAGIDKQRFNEAAAHGRYPCAPKVLKGGIRAFREEDVVVLFIYARLGEKRFPPSLAGEIACAVKAKLKESPDTGIVRIPIISQTSAELIDTSSRNSTERNLRNSAIVEMSFDIESIRAAIQPQLKAWLAGEDHPERRK